MASYRYRSGKWQARIQRWQILAQKSFTNKRDAERWARQIEAEIERGEYKPPSPINADQPETLYELRSVGKRRVQTV